jgi:branched-chain amino acid transport system permease protein
MLKNLLTEFSEFWNGKTLRSKLITIAIALVVVLLVLSIPSLTLFVIALAIVVRLLSKRYPKQAKFIAGGAVLATALLLPHIFVTDGDGILPLFTVVLCAVYALFALGLNVVVGYAGLLDLGYVAFFLFGAYVGAWLMSDFFHTKNVHILDVTSNTIPGIHLSFWFVVVVAGVVAALAGVVIGAPTLRLKSDYLALVTLGFGEILPEVFRNVEKVTNGTKGIGPIDGIGVGPLQYLPSFDKTIGSSDFIPKYYVILLFCAIFVWISLKLRDGRLGRAWMAIREDELAASLMGVPLMQTKLWSYAVGALAGGVGGAFYATIVGTVNVDGFTFAFSVIVLCSVILGGMGNVWGVILGAVVITWFNYTGLKWMGTKVSSAVGSKVDLVQFNFGLFGLVLVLMMLFRPDGFIPAARSKQVKKATALVEEAAQ